MKLWQEIALVVLIVVLASVSVVAVNYAYHQQTVMDVLRHNLDKKSQQIAQMARKSAKNSTTKLSENKTENP